MKFLIDAHLPMRLAQWFSARGHPSIHTLEFPEQNRTTDRSLMAYADENDFIVVTKDADFVDAFYVLKTPKKLFLISTGNITNRELELLIERNMASIEEMFQTYRFIELNRTQIIAHN